MNKVKGSCHCGNIQYTFFTDMELEPGIPVEDSQCGECVICVDKCPADAATGLPLDMPTRTQTSVYYCTIINGTDEIVGPYFAVKIDMKHSWIGKSICHQSQQASQLIFRVFKVNWIFG